jgi:hypothetical protein
VIAALASRAFAQSERERFERQMELIRNQTLLTAPTTTISADQRLYIDWGAYAIFDYLSVDDSRNENHILRQHSLVGFARANLDGVHDVLLRGRLIYQDFNDGDSFDGRGDEFIDPDFDRAYYQFDLAKARAAYDGKQTSVNLIFQGGRNFAYWANGLVLGTTLDGVSFTLTAGPFTANLIAGVTPVRTVDFDTSRPAFDYNTRRGFYGGLVSMSAGQHRPFAYFLMQRDYNDEDELQTGNVNTKFDYNSYYIGVGSTGTFSDRLFYGAELVFEGGENLSNSFEIQPPFLVGIDQDRNEIHAWAADVRLDYLFNDLARTRVNLEFLAASGDDDRIHTSNTFGGNLPGTKDTSFNAFGLLNTGLAFAPSVSNLLMLRAGVSSFPFHNYKRIRNMQLGADLFVYGKFDADAPLAETTLENGYLGWEPDVFINWQVTSDLTLAFRYGIFFPSSEAFPDDDVRQFFSFTATLAL